MGRPSQPTRRSSPFRRDPHVWSLAILAYLVVALILAITVTEHQRQSETAVDLTLRQTGAELALALSNTTAAGWSLSERQDARLRSLWVSATAGVTPRDHLFALVATPNREVLWSVGKGATLDSARGLVTATFPVPSAMRGQTMLVIVGHSAAEPWGGLASILILFALFAIIPGIGAFFLFRPLASGMALPDDMPLPEDRRTPLQDIEDDDALTEALTHAGCGLVQWTDRSTALTLSQSMCALLGQDAEDMDAEEGLPREAFRQYLDKGTRDIIERIEHHAHVDGHLTFDHHGAILGPDGDQIPVKITGIALPGEGRAPMRFAAIWSDQSDQARLAYDAERAATRFKLLLDSLNDGIALWDGEGYLVAANGVFAKRLGLPGSAMTRALRFPQINAMGETFEREGHWYRKRVVPLGDEGQLVILTDVTKELERGQKIKTLKARVDTQEQELMTLDDALMRKEEAVEALERKANFEATRAESAQQAMAEFLSNASHELRTPLNAILGFSEMIQQEIFGPLGNEKYKEYVADIHASGQSLLDLIQDLLDMSRLASGRVEMDPGRINVSELLGDAKRLARPMADEKGIDVALGETQVPSAYADEPAVKRILLHLLSNAIKFTPKGGRVTLAANADLRMVNITVSDTGVGIEAEDLDRLGQPFARTRRAEESGEPGMGLGLAMSRKLAELNYGSLKIDSDFGRGTSVTISLPRRAPGADTPKVDVQSEASALASGKAPLKRAS